MFPKTIVSNLLNKYLGKYISNLDAKNLEFSIFDGDLELKDLQLKPEALASLDLPIEVKAGYVGYIKLDIPWTSLFQSSIVITLRDVYVLAGPISDRPYDPEREERLLNAIKRQKLEALELSMLQNVAESSNSSEESSGFFEKLTASIINNVQVSIENIHVRYEDTVTNPDHPFACGIMLHKVEAYTTNSSWEEAKENSTSVMFHKLVNLNGLSLYWNPYVPEQHLLRSRLNTDGWRNLLRTSITSHSIFEEDFDFLIEPVAAQARLIINKGNDFSVPRFFVDFSFHEVEILLFRQQYNKASIAMAKIIVEEYKLLQSKLARPLTQRPVIAYKKNKSLKDILKLVSVVILDKKIFPVPVCFSAHKYRQQFLNLLSLQESFQLMSVNQRYRKYQPNIPLRVNPKSWWLYAYNAVLEENIRPYSWEKIKQHRVKYRAYKNTYRQWLQKPEDDRLKSKLWKLEEDLDVTNILVAREDAKVEYAHLVPNATKVKEKKEGWFDWMFGSDEKDIVEVETPISTGFLSQLSEDDKKKLFRQIGYDSHSGNLANEPNEYVAHKIQVSLNSCCVSLVNYSKKILQLSVTHLLATLENRPASDGFRISTNTESFSVEGASIEHELVPILTSDVGVYAPAVNQVFTLDFEKNPLFVEADFSLRLNIQPVEIVYDEHSLSEVTAFFQVPHISVDVKAAAMETLGEVAKYSRAGLQYAIQQHKTFHVAFNMRSPYIVIPEHGTLHRGGSVLVCDLGTLRIESELQPKDVSLEDATMSEIESKLYDQFRVTLTDVKVLLADSGDDWHTAQTQPDSDYHILPSVGLTLTFFNAVKQNFKELPQQKLVANLPTLKLNISDHRVFLLLSFFSNFPLPTSASMITIGEDTVDAPTAPALTASPLNLDECQTEPDVACLRRIRRSVLKRLVSSTPSEDSNAVTADMSDAVDTGGNNRSTSAYYSASDHSDEDLDEWGNEWDVKEVDDHSSSCNSSQILIRVQVGEIVLQLARHIDGHEVPYLMFRLNRVCLDAAITVYGLVAHASLGGLQLVDKIHIGSAGEYMELLTSQSDSDLISVTYRKVSPDCPDFESVYQNTEQTVAIRFHVLAVTFDRAALLYFINFSQDMLNSFHNIEMKASTSTVISIPEVSEKDSPSLFKRLVSVNDEADGKVNGNITQLKVVTYLNDISFKFNETDRCLAELHIKGLEGLLTMKARCNVIRCRLQDLSLEDCAESAIFPHILMIEDDKVFDLKFVMYKKSARKPLSNDDTIPGLDFNIRLRVGQVQFVYLNKILWDFTRFFDPFMNPEVTEAYKAVAIETVSKQVESIDTENKRIQLFVDIRTPTILLPQNSQSPDLLMIKLGDLSIRNFYEKEELSDDTKQEWNHFYLYLDSLHISRVNMSMADDSFHVRHTILEPISFKGDVKKAMHPVVSDVSIDIDAHLDMIKINLMPKDIKLMVKIWEENLNEGAPQSSPVGVVEAPKEMVVGSESVGSATPVVEHRIMVPTERPNLSAISVNLSLQGLSITLHEETIDYLNRPVDDGMTTWPLSKFEMRFVEISASRHTDGAIMADFQLNNITMEDIRPNSDIVVRKILQQIPKRPGSGNPTPVVDIMYKVTNDGVTKVDFKVEKIRLNLNIPYILLLTKFIGDAFPKKTEGVVSRTMLRSLSHTGSEDGNTEKPENFDSSLTIYGKVKNPEIVLFADPTVKNSPVLVLRADLDMEYGNHVCVEHLAAKLEAVELISCIYGRADQSSTKVILPCSIEFSRIYRPEKNILEMTALLTKVDMHLSAPVVRLFLEVFAMLQWPKEQRTPPEGSTDPNENEEDLWGVKSTTSARWLNRIDEVDEPPTSPFKYTTSPVEVFKLNITEVNVFFEVENLDSNVPILCLRTSLDTELNDWSKEFQISGEFHLEMCFFNELLGVWEPLVEPVMESENIYRPWEVLIKIVKARSHPITCNYEETTFDLQDGMENEVQYLMHRSRAHSSSSDAETDSSSEMTVIRHRIPSKPRHGSDRSYDSISHHGSIQGESDSEPEGFIHTMTNKLGSIFSSDSSDADVSETDDNDDTFDPGLDKPVFMTSQGPVHVHAGGVSDAVDGARDQEDENTSLCTYILIQSRDKLNINLTPIAITVIKDVAEALTQPGCCELTKDVDLPALEIHNQLGLHCNVTLHPLVKYHPNHVTGCTVRRPGRTLSHPSPDEDDIVILDEEDDVDGCEVDGLRFLDRALADISNTLISAGAFVFEDNQEFLAADKIDKDKLRLEVIGFHTFPTVLFKRACHRLLPLTPSKCGDIMELENSSKYSAVLDIDMSHGRKVVSLYSPLQLENNLLLAVDVFCKTEDLKKYPAMKIKLSNGEFTRLSTVQPQDTLHIPLMAAYHCPLFVAPTDLGYQATYNPIWWKDLIQAKEKSKYFTCLSEDGDKKFFNIKVICKDGERTNPGQIVPKTVPYYTITLNPPVLLHNYLPYDLQFSLEGTSRASSLTHGEKAPLYTVDIQKMNKLSIQISDYLNCDWTGSLDISQDMDEFKAISMETEADGDTANKHLSLSIHANQTHSLDLYIYSPYWIINKTELPIHLRGSSTEAVLECSTMAYPLLFRYKKHRRKKAKLRVYESSWSHSFSLDTVGTSGVVICQDKERNRKYQFMLQMQMSQLQLTKIVTITPYFLVVNQSSHSLRYMEENEHADLWLDLPIGACVPFWPVTESFNMYVKYEYSVVCSQHFPIKTSHSTVLRMERGSAMCVDVSGGVETPVTITYTNYDNGDAPVRVENLCEDVFIKIHQKNQSQVTLLSPNQSMLYTWDNPSSERTLMWNVYGRKQSDYPAFITKDSYGDVVMFIQTLKSSGLTTDVTDGGALAESSPEDYSDDPDGPLISGGNFLKKMRTDKVVIHWISYLDGQQRVLLFTQDERIAKHARLNHVQGIDIPHERGHAKMNQAEQASLAIFTSLEGVGVSLINSLYEEVAYGSLMSSASVWEVEVNGRWKLLSGELAAWLEDKWKNDHLQANLQDQIEADLLKMTMKKPFMGSLRRTKHSGLWFQYRKSEHHTAIHAKVHRVQIDNQLSDAYFPTVLYPSATPRFVVKKSGFKPFMELGIMRRTVPENNIDTFRYFKVLVQEFNISLDKGFIVSVFDIFSSLQKQEEESYQLQSDLRVAQRTLQEVAEVLALTRPHKVYYEYLHLSPFKLHISISLSGTPHLSYKKPSSISSDIVDFFLNSIGATLPEMKAVEIRMAYFERRGVMMSMDQFMSQVQSHYTHQAIQQVYVFIFGLDVLGNPYGLIKDFTQGLGDLFYEPFLGSIQGSDEFADSIVRGVHSLLGNTIGGTAGSLSLITGSLGRALAVMSFDEDYRRKRQLRMQQQPRNIPASLALATKSFVLGIGLGLSGVVLNPWRGAQEDGVEGFFKGVGKGILGLLTKPAGGVVDMISMGFDGLRRAVEMDEGIVVRMRLPRFINPYMGLKPFSPYQAAGYRLLHNLEKGQYARTDIYWAHAALSKDERSDVVLFTDHHIFLLEKCRLWGDWDIEWQVSMESLVGVPAVTDGKLILRIKKDDSHSANIFLADQQEVSSPDHELLEWLQQKVEQLLKFRQL